MTIPMMTSRAVSGTNISEWAPAACAASRRFRPVPEAISLICSAVMDPNAGRKTGRPAVRRWWISFAGSVSSHVGGGDRGKGGEVSGHRQRPAGAGAVPGGVGGVRAGPGGGGGRGGRPRGGGPGGGGPGGGVRGGGG